MFGQQVLKPEPGVSFALAQYRHLAITNIYYELYFKIPEYKSQSIGGEESISFNLSKTSESLQVDFKQDNAHLKTLSINGKHVAAEVTNEHIIIDKKYLIFGHNTIRCSFIAGDASLHRSDDYLYALFVPDRARTVFPCFEQPDLKAIFQLKLQAPKDFKVLANAKLKDSATEGDFTNYNFYNSDKLPTYLFSFTAGKYLYLQQKLDKYPAQFLHRETDTAKIRLSVDSIFQDHKNAISFLENWTGIKFPFQKVGFVAIPDFQFGGMEHPGEVQYKASSLFLDNGATKDMIIGRANLISHETAHMWFGDMVTMQWFNDVWMKEVFANFMADKVSENIMGTETFNLKFLQDHYPAAYGVDRTRGANPIRQQLSNLQEAGSLYGNIIYHKAPIMMRQLELLMGKENFRTGIKEYLKKNAYSNATWPNLISILSKHTKTDLYKWNAVWVNQPGRPVFSYKIDSANGRITQFKIIQKPESGSDRIWPQSFHIKLIYPESEKEILVVSDKGEVMVKDAIGNRAPVSIIFNSDGMGYGVFPKDKNLTAEIFDVQSPVTRASVYINAYENMLSNSGNTPSQLISYFSNGMKKEKNEMNLRLLSGYVSNIFWTFITPTERSLISNELENAMWTAMQANILANNKKILFKAYQEIYTTPAASNTIYSIWKEQKPPELVKLSEDDYTSLALSIALKNDTASTVLKSQEARISNLDRRKRLEFLMPALSADSMIRDAFFISLQNPMNRQKESYVTTALSYLNHPMRQNTSIKFLAKSLEMVEEIQKTGDVFFPQSWLGAILSNYQSKEANDIVNHFLVTHDNYPEKLKAKILQATDNLYRAQRLLDRN